MTDTLNLGNIGLESWGFENRMARVMAAARATKFPLPLPLSATAHPMFMQASSAGHGQEEDSTVIKIFAGIHLPTVKSTGANGS